ncbi:MAG: hypothetical protein FWB80_09985 [Defluviitaleaceae bacterium]|nr:hypothetical protein [Defluviitaleaceae bacterium]
MKSPSTIIDADVTQISERYSALKGISLDESLKRVIASKTYSTLNNTETGLCYEMTDYVYDMFLEEMGDIDEL